MSEFSPDLVLAQETFNPQDYFPNTFPQNLPSVIWAPVSEKWGSAIYSARHKLSPVHVPDFEGWVAGGRIDDLLVGEVSKPFYLFSAHAPTAGRDEKKVSYEKRVHEMLDRVHEITNGADILIAGDFNLDTAVRHSSEELKNKKAELVIIDRLRKEFGLINSWQALHPNTNLPQTLRWSSDKSKPYHCDGIFIPHSWVRYLESCDIVSDGWTELSDHNPIVATFNS